jgi:hypothetical protein
VAGLSFGAEAPLENHSVTSHTITVAGGRFAPGRLEGNELGQLSEMATGHVPSVLVIGTALSMIRTPRLRTTVNR